MSSGPIWARPGPGARRPRFTREEIAAAAIAIADADGFEAVSMRRVAAELGAGTMTLYHYVGTKDELLALMDDAIMGELLVPDDELPADDWRAALTEIARRTRAVFQRHPWAFYGMGRGGAGPSPNALRHFEQSLTAVSSLALADLERMEVIALIDDYVFGYSLGEVRERDEHHGEEEIAAVVGYMEDQLASGEFPRMKALVGDTDVRSYFERMIEIARGMDRFERGLDTVLDGIAVRAARAAQ